MLRTEALCVYWHSRMPKLTVLLESRLSRLFEAYCKQEGFKKSTLVVKLIRDHLRAAGFANQAELFSPNPNASSESHRKKRG